MHIQIEIERNEQQQQKYVSNLQFGTIQSLIIYTLTYSMSFIGFLMSYDDTQNFT